MINTQPVTGVTTMPSLIRPEDLLEIISDAEMAKMEERRQEKRKAEAHELELREAFMVRDVDPQVVERINKAVRIAAGQGSRQLQVMTFPCRFCSDRGRAINNGDPEWPSTLEGFAKRAFEFYVKELKPLGYKLHAEIISFPGGIPGDVGLFLKW
jgi:hypothetical protein